MARRMAAALLTMSLSFCLSAREETPAPAPAPGDSAKPPAADAAVPRKLTMDLLVDYLDRWGISRIQADRENRIVFFNVLYEGVQFRFSVSILGGAGDALFVNVMNVAALKKDQPGLAEALLLLLAENFHSAVGAWAFDPEDGEVAFDYVFLAAAGLSYADFARGMDHVIVSVHKGRSALLACLKTAAEQPEPVPPPDEKPAPAAQKPAPAADEKPVPPADEKPTPPADEKPAPADEKPAPAAGETPPADDAAPVREGANPAAPPHKDDGEGEGAAIIP